MARFTTVQYWLLLAILVVIVCSYFVSAEIDGIEWFQGSAVAYGRKGKFSVEVPDGAEPGDTLIVLLNRSDGPLPLRLDGFQTSSASCLKSENAQKSCLHLDECARVSSNGGYCSSFGDGERGWDLSTVVYTRVLTSVSISRSPLLNIDLTELRITNARPGWSMAIAVRGLSFDAPIRSYAGVSCDNSRQSVFADIPEDGAKVGDPLLLTMAFDDAVPDPDDFIAPEGTQQIAYISGNDEAGFVYAKTLSTLDITDPNTYVTTGEGAYNCKDELLTLVLKPGDGSDTIKLAELEIRDAKEEERRKKLEENKRAASSSSLSKALIPSNAWWICFSSALTLGYMSLAFWI